MGSDCAPEYCRMLQSSEVKQDNVTKQVNGLRQHFGFCKIPNNFPEEIFNSTRSRLANVAVSGTDSTDETI